MAKGFTVKAKAPVEKKKVGADWDLMQSRKGCVVRQLYFVYLVEDVLLHF